MFYSPGRQSIGVINGGHARTTRRLVKRKGRLARMQGRVIRCEDEFVAAEWRAGGKRRVIGYDQGGGLSGG